MSLLKQPFLAALITLNLAALVLTAADKLKAQKGGRRVPERVLLLFAAAGGSAGVLLAMLLFRHKTRKSKFRFGVPFIIVTQIALVFYLISRNII